MLGSSDQSFLFPCRKPCDPKRCLLSLETCIAPLLRERIEDDPDHAWKNNQENDQNERVSYISKLNGRHRKVTFARNQSNRGAMSQCFDRTLTPRQSSRRHPTFLTHAKE